jgi:hypothetical protein
MSFEQPTSSLPQLNFRRLYDFALPLGRAGRPSLQKKNYGSLN